MTEKERRQRGNVLFMILIAVFLVGALTLLVARSSEEQSDVLDRQTSDDEINRLFTYSATLQGTIEQMIIAGAEPTTLYTNLSILKPGDAGYETAPHAMKIYHPLGGGVAHKDKSKPGTSPVATTYKISKGSIVTGVGATDAVVGDILFTAVISTAEACGRINQLLTGSSAIPVMVTLDFDTLFAGTAVTIDGVNCANCVNKARACVTNTEEDAWGYYTALLPG